MHSNLCWAKEAAFCITTLQSILCIYLIGKSSLKLVRLEGLLKGSGTVSGVIELNSFIVRVSSLINEVKKDGKVNPGEAYVATFTAGTLAYNVGKGILEATEKIIEGKNPWKDNSQNSPIHVLGSFKISIRVNANGTTATICVYDSKIFNSFSDGKAGKDSDKKRKDYILPQLTNTYQRYLWNVNL